MQVVPFELCFVIRCVKCGTERDAPEHSDRVLQTGDTIYLDTAERCRCGSSRVRIDMGVVDPDTPDN